MRMSDKPDNPCKKLTPSLWEEGTLNQERFAATCQPAARLTGNQERNADRNDSNIPEAPKVSSVERMTGILVLPNCGIKSQ